MYRTKSETKLVWWPTPQDYNEAIQTPQLSLHDEELKKGLPYTNALELPRSITGSFASVYRMHCQKKDFALRLFLSNIPDQHERYALISGFVQGDDLPYTVTFDFLKEGINVHGEWLPALKMDWLEGEQLDDYIVANLGNPEKLGLLLDKFVKMMQDMRRVGIAHGDLQHGNILVCKDELRLVDYDGMFVPAMKDFSAGELGHRNYQHPERAAHHFGPYLDNFSAWVIYASVRALQIDSRLMHQLGGGDDCLLFRQSDFMDPSHSAAFAAMETHSDLNLRELSRFMRLQLKNDLQKIPYLELPVPQVGEQELHPVEESVPVVRSGARLVRGNLPDWLELEKTVPTKSAQQAVWLKPGQASKSSQSTGAKTPSKVHSSHAAQLQLPPELQSKSPRKVKWNKSSERINPLESLAMMLLNPAIWMMFYLAFSAYSIDSELETAGVRVPVTVTSMQARPAKSGDSRINYNYTVDDQIYSGSEHRRVDAKTIDELGNYSIYVLPDRPTVHESLNAERGSKRLSDQCYAFICLVINLLITVAILRDPLRDRKLAQRGQPLLAKIDALKIVDLATTGDQHYMADISFSWAGKERYHRIHLRLSEYKSLQVGSSELILYDEIKDKPILYRFCRYNAVNSTSSQPVKWLKP